MTPPRFYIDAALMIRCARAAVFCCAIASVFPTFQAATIDRGESNTLTHKSCSANIVCCALEAFSVGYTSLVLPKDFAGRPQTFDFAIFTIQTATNSSAAGPLYSIRRRLDIADNLENESSFFPEETESSIEGSCWGSHSCTISSIHLIAACVLGLLELRCGATTIRSVPSPQQHTDNGLTVEASDVLSTLPLHLVALDQPQSHPVMEVLSNLM